MRIEVAMTHMVEPLNAAISIVFEDDTAGPELFERKQFLEALYEELGMDKQELGDSEWESPFEVLMWMPADSSDEEPRAAFVARYHDHGTTLRVAGIVEWN